MDCDEFNKASGMLNCAPVQGTRSAKFRRAPECAYHLKSPNDKNRPAKEMSAADASAKKSKAKETASKDTALTLKSTHAAEEGKTKASKPAPKHVAKRAKAKETSPNDKAVTEAVTKDPAKLKAKAEKNPPTLRRTTKETLAKGLNVAKHQARDASPNSVHAKPDIGMDTEKKSSAEPVPRTSTQRTKDVKSAAFMKPKASQWS